MSRQLLLVALGAVALCALLLVLHAYLSDPVELVRCGNPGRLRLVALLRPGLIRRNGIELLKHACLAANNRETMWLLQQGAPVNGAPGELGPLKAAALAGNSWAVSVLLNAGADPNVPDADGEAPLHDAARLGDREMIEALLAAGADANAVSRLPGAPTPLLRAVIAKAPPAAVAALLEHGADPDVPDAEGRTPLHLAVGLSSWAIARMLIEAGADVDQKDTHGHSPLSVAVSERNTAMIRLLVASGALPSGAFDGMESYIGSASVTEDAVLALMDAGVVASFPAGYGGTSLHLAAAHGWCHVAARLLADGADPDAHDEYGRTPLHLAAGVGDARMVQTLLDAGASPNAADSAGFSALDWLLSHASAMSAFAEALAHDERPGNRTEGVPCLETTSPADLPEVARLLLDAGADPNGLASLYPLVQDDTADLLGLLLEQGLDPDRRDPAGWSLLHYAAAAGNVRVVDTLCAQGADVNLMGAGGRTALDLAIGPVPSDLVDLVGPTVTANDRRAVARDLREHGGKTGAELQAEQTAAAAGVGTGGVSGGET